MTPYWQSPDGALTLYHGEALAVLAALPDASVDAVICDPPYSSGGQFRGDRTDNDTHSKYVHSGTDIVRPDFAGDNRDQRAYGYWCALWLSECLRAAKPGSPICLFTDWRQLPVTTDALQAGGWVWRGIVPWDKTEAARPSLGRFRSQCEYVVWGSAGPMPIDEDSSCLAGAYTVPVKQTDKHHIAGKPTELMRYIVRICRAGGVALDPFAGSGTTGVACLLEGRGFIGVEKERAYVQKAQQRLQAVVARPRLASQPAPLPMPLFDAPDTEDARHVG